MKKNKPGGVKPTVVQNTAKPQPAKNNAATPENKSNLWKYGIAILIPICAIFIYSKTLDYPLDKLDETAIFSNIEQFKTTHTSIWDAVHYDAFFGNSSDAFFYRPVQNITYLMDIEKWGPVPFGVRLTNLVLFIGIALSLLYLLTLFDVSFLFAGIISLLFVCHPLYATSVVWVPSRGDLLSTLFSVLSLICFIRYIDSRKTVFFVGSMVFFFIAVFSKESVIGLPALFIVYLFIKDRNFYKNKSNVTILVSLMGVSVLYLAARMAVSSSFHGTGESLFSISNFFNNLRTIAEAAAKTIIPMDLSPMPDYSGTLTIIGILVLAAFIGLVVKFNSKLPYLFFGLFWFLLFIAPAMFYQHRYALHSYKYLEHRILLPSLGLFLIIALASKYFLQRREKIVLIAGGILAVIFIGYTSNYVDIFENQFTFYKRVITVDPNNVLAHNNLANCYFRANKFDSAIYEGTAAIKVFPHFTMALVNRSKIFAKLGYNDKAIADLDTLVTLDPGNFDLYAMRGNIENTIGKYPEALTDFNKSLQLKADNAEVVTNKGTMFDKLNQKDSAMAYFKKAMQMDPTLPWPYINAGLLETNRQQFIEGIGYFNKAIQIKPDYWDAYLNRGIAYYYIKDYTKALADYNLYLSKVPNNTLVLNNIGILKINMGLKNEGCATLQKAAALGNTNAAENVKIYCK